MKGKEGQLSDDMFNRNYWYRKFLNVAALDQYSQLDEQVQVCAQLVGIVFSQTSFLSHISCILVLVLVYIQAAYKGEVDIFANEPFDRKKQEDKYKLLEHVNFVLDLRLHLLKRNLKARQWNRQFLGIEPTAEELAADKADEELIQSAQSAMGRAESARRIAQFGLMSKEELAKRLKAIGGIEKLKENLKQALGE